MRQLFEHWPVWAVMSALFAALTAILGKIGVEGIDSNFATLIRVLVLLPVLVVLVVLLGIGQPLSSITPRTYLFLALSGLATGASWLCYYHALKLGPASQVAPVDKLSVVFVAILAVLLLGEHMSAKHWFGIALVTGGALLLALG